MTPAHTQSWPSLPKPALVGLRSHEPRPPWPGWFTRAAVTPGHGGHVKRRAFGRFLRPHGRVGRDADLISSIDYTTIYSPVYVQGTWNHVSPVAERVPNRPRVVGPALCMMQPSRTSLVRACLRDSCPPAWRGCSRHLVCETMVLSTALSMPRVRVAGVALSSGWVTCWHNASDLMMVVRASWINTSQKGGQSLEYYCDHSQSSLF